MVPLFVWFIRRVGAVPVILTTYILSVVYASFVGGPLQHQLPGELRYFMAGTACYYGWPYLSRHWKPIAALSVAVLAVNSAVALGWVVPAAVGVLTICCGMFCYLGDFGRYGDFSYGVYILHFPIMQTFAQAGAFAKSPWLALTCAVVVTLLGAVFLWYAIERRFLRREISVKDTGATVQASA